MNVIKIIAMKKTVLSLTMLVLMSCQIFKERGVHIKIVNHTDGPITKVIISTSEKLDHITLDTLSPNESNSNFLSMKNNKTDGSYTLEYELQDGSKINDNHGYYTNGGALDEWIRFDIKNDTTLVKFGNFPK